MQASVLLDACRDAGIGLFAGVPDSFLSGLCDELYKRYGTDSPSHIVAHNEGGAIALCAGHFLATGHPALCYMQNSGIGNAVNPLVSLMDRHVYGIPCLLVIGWRGEPGMKDEPQHIMQGEITLSQLELLGIPYSILSPDTTEHEFTDIFSFLLSVMKQNTPAALIVRKGALVSDSRPAYGNTFRMTRETAAEILLEYVTGNDLVVSTTGKLSREIFEIRERRCQPHMQDFLTVGSMGHASMIALGMAEQMPGRRIWCLDGDGAAMMHLGALTLIGQRFPKNLIHVVIDNGAHDTVGGMPVCSGSLDLQSLALAAGYPHVLSADSEKQLSDVLAGMLSYNPDGPLFLEIRCACGSRKDLGRPTVSPSDNMKAMMDFITKNS